MYSGDHALVALSLSLSLSSQISLPAFILEKRSNLEMVADMFAYTELFAW